MTRSCAPDEKVTDVIRSPACACTCVCAIDHGCPAGLGCLTALDSRGRCQEPAGQFWGAGGTRRVWFGLVCFAPLRFAMLCCRSASPRTSPQAPVTSQRGCAAPGVRCDVIQALCAARRPMAGSG